MTRQSVLVVDDEADILELVKYNLGKNGYEVACAASGEDALDMVRKQTPDLIVLDLMLPGVDGLDVCRNLKGDDRTKHVPILMLTARGEESDIVAGLEIGADDYLTKPFSPRVLVARVRAVLRRKSVAAPSTEEILRIHDMEINPGRHEVRLHGKAVDMTRTEFRILHFLARRPGWVFTRYQIVDGSQGADALVTERSVDVHVVSLRKKLGDDGEMIQTVRGVGYKLKDRE